MLAISCHYRADLTMGEIELGQMALYDAAHGLWVVSRDGILAHPVTKAVTGRHNWAGLDCRLRLGVAARLNLNVNIDER